MKEEEERGMRPEVVRVIPKVVGELLIVKKAVGVCDAEEEPSKAAELEGG